LRVSTSEQTTRNQRRELREVAERHDWDVVATFEDRTSRAPRAAMSALALTPWRRPSHAARSIWSPRGQWTGLDAP
jgi:hypothetical protein